MASQVIRSYAYDPDRTELTVNFESGRAYVYSLVPAHIFAGFDADRSKGGFFNRHIRDAYPFRKMKLDARLLQSTLLDALKASTAAPEEATPVSGQHAWQSGGSRDHA